MAIQHRADRRLPWRVYWINPHTGKQASKNFLAEAEARKYDSLMRHRIKHEPASFRTEDAPPTNGGTVESIVYLYLKERQLNPHNLNETLRHATPVFAVIGNVLVQNLGKEDMQRAVKALKAAGNKANTINRRIGIIKTALNWAEDSGLIESNPVHRFKCPRGKSAKLAPPTPAEAEAILAVSPGHLLRVIVLGLSFGVRVGESELFRLRWADFDLERQTVRVWAANKNENRPWRDLHLREDLIPTLRTWREDGHEYVIHAMRYRKAPGGECAWADGPVTTVKRSWRSALGKAGIVRRIRPYDLRHAFATYALDSGADPKAVAEVMGHADMSMIHEHYQHVLNRQRKAVMGKAPMPSLDICPGHILGANRADFQPSAKENIKQ